MIDTHTHLYLSKTPTEDLVSRAQEAGVHTMISISVDPESARQSLTLSKEYSCIYPTVGIHPLYKDAFNSLDEIRQLLESTEAFVAIGEIGLDYHYGEETKLEQQRVFRAQLDLAREFGKPVVIHNRKSNEDLIPILAEYRDIKTVLHCFSSGPEFVDALWHDNMYISFTGMITYAKKGKTLRALKQIPLDRIMIETDMPYLVPEAYHGLENEPAFVVEVAKKIAEIKDCSVAEVERVTDATACTFFGISP